MINKCNCQIPNTDLTGWCFKCGGTIETPADVQERIKAEAEIYTKDEGYQKVYIAGATAERERAQHNEKVFEDTMQQILNTVSWIDDQHLHDTLLRVVNTAKEQWKGEKQPDNPCPHCGKELSRDRNLCCWECGKEVETVQSDNICGICKERPMGEGISVCDQCYNSFDGDRRGFWNSDEYQ